MSLLAFQADPTPQPQAQPAPVFNIDLSGIGKVFVDYLESRLSDIGDNALSLFTSALERVWEGVWNTGANLIGYTDPTWTTRFGPVAAVMGQSRSLLYAILLLALTALLIRHLATSILGGGGTLLAFFDDLLVVVAKEAGFFAGLDAMVAAVNGASRLIGWQDVGSLQGLLPSDQLSLLLMVALIIFFTIRLFIRGGYRMVWLGILTAFAPVWIALEALPFETCKRWSRVCATQWLGWLWGQVPSTFAVSVGIQLAVAVGGLGGVFLVVGFLQVAYDLYGYMTSGSAGGGLLGGLVAGITGRVGGAMRGGAGGGLSAAAASAAGITNNQALADRFGY